MSVWWIKVNIRVKHSNGAGKTKMHRRSESLPICPSSYLQFVPVRSYYRASLRQPAVTHEKDLEEETQRWIAMAQNKNMFANAIQATCLILLKLLLKLFASFSRLLDLWAIAMNYSVYI